MLKRIFLMFALTAGLLAQNARPQKSEAKTDGGTIALRGGKLLTAPTAVRPLARS